MNAGEKSLLLLKSAKAVRMFASGILIVIFYYNLFMKDITEQVAAWIQATAFMGTVSI